MNQACYSFFPNFKNQNKNIYKAINICRTVLKKRLKYVEIVYTTVNDTNKIMIND